MFSRSQFCFKLNIQIIHIEFQIVKNYANISNFRNTFISNYNNLIIELKEFEEVFRIVQI